MKYTLGNLVIDNIFLVISLALDNFQSKIFIAIIIEIKIFLVISLALDNFLVVIYSYRLPSFTHMLKLGKIKEL